MHHTAQLLKVLPPNGVGAVHHVYEMTPPYYGHRYVLVSAATVMFSGPETYIFPCDEHGEVESWGEMDGSYKGGLDHTEALRGAGYKVTE